MFRKLFFSVSSFFLSKGPAVRSCGKLVTSLTCNVNFKYHQLGISGIYRDMKNFRKPPVGLWRRHDGYSAAAGGAFQYRRPHQRTTASPFKRIVKNINYATHK
jgi:hypothetical protein